MSFFHWEGVLFSSPRRLCASLQHFHGELQAHQLLLDGLCGNQGRHVAYHARDGGGLGFRVGELCEVYIPLYEGSLEEMAMVGVATFTVITFEPGLLMITGSYSRFPLTIL